MESFVLEGVLLMEGFEIEVFEKIQEIIVSELGLKKEEITEDTALSEDLGVDSIDLFQIVMALEDEYGVEFTNEDAESIRTVKDVVMFITQKV